MRRFASTEVSNFFRSVDATLSTPCRVLLIGGSAIGLKYKSSHITADIDLWNSHDAHAFSAAVQMLRATPMIPVQVVTIGEAPRDFEDRLTPLHISGLKNLTVLVPEAHDLVFMKLARADSHDLDAIEDIHAASPLDLQTLVQRFHETDHIGPPSDHELAFLSMLARLFGEAVALRIASQLRD